MYNFQSDGKNTSYIFKLSAAIVSISLRQYHKTFTFTSNYDLKCELLILLTYVYTYTRLCYAFSIDKEYKKTEIYFNEICKMRWKSIISNASPFMWKFFFFY